MTASVTRPPLPFLVSMLRTHTTKSRTITASAADSTADTVATSAISGATSAAHGEMLDVGGTHFLPGAWIVFHL